MSRKLVLQFAMRVEAAPLMDALSLKRDTGFKSRYPFEIYSGKYRSLEIVLGLAGTDSRFNFDAVGSLPAGLLTHFLLEHEPDLLINPGTAGGYEAKGARIGQVFLGAPRVCFHSRRSAIPEMDEMGRGNFPAADSSGLARALGLRQAIVSSGDALDCSADDAKYISLNQAELKEMEAAAIGYVCELEGKPLLPIKAITDFVDHPVDTATQFLANYRVASEALARETLRVLGYLDSCPDDLVFGG